MTTIIRKRLKATTSAIAVLTYNQPRLVGDLCDIFGPYLLVIDNGSTIPIPYVTTRVPENRYFSGGWNYAMKEIDADWVAMLNDDIEAITLEMIDELIDDAERNNFDVISPAMNGPHQHMNANGTGLRQVPFIDWVAPIIRKKAWDDVGGFNEAFPGYGSDLDIAYRLRQKGYRLGVSDVHVIHHMGGTAALAAGTQHIQGNVTAMNETLHRLYGVQDWTEFVRTHL